MLFLGLGEMKKGLRPKSFIRKKYGAKTFSTKKVGEDFLQLENGAKTFLRKNKGRRLFFRQIFPKTQPGYPVNFERSLRLAFQNFVQIVKD